MNLNYRTVLKESDIKDLSEILVSTSFFYDSEVDIIRELVQENLAKGEDESGYIFNVAEKDSSPAAFTCYGPVPGTKSSFDLYWIAVHNKIRGQGLGKILMDMAVKDIRSRGGKNIWIETSSRPLYKPTRHFYLSYGCEKAAELDDYYGENDNKVIFRLRTDI